jgi:hypothetical protein
MLLGAYPLAGERERDNAPDRHIVDTFDVTDTLPGWVFTVTESNAEH